MDNSNLKNLLIEFLAEEGYRHKETNFGLEFKSNGLTILFINSSNDEQIFQLILPGIYEMNDENELAVLQAANKVSYEFKVVKAYVDNDNDVNVSFQILADSTPELNELMPRAIRMLEQARADFYRNLGV
ncbi:MAG: YbjN domain-containing protein [Muribaculaceae bacterium]|nr:YbjN domain-containing protein [Muribaculaceae bacterium]